MDVVYPPPQRRAIGATRDTVSTTLGVGPARRAETSVRPDAQEYAHRRQDGRGVVPHWYEAPRGCHVAACRRQCSLGGGGGDTDALRVKGRERTRVRKRTYPDGLHMHPAYCESIPSA